MTETEENQKMKLEALRLSVDLITINARYLLNEPLLDDGLFCFPYKKILEIVEFQSKHFLKTIDKKIESLREKEQENE